MSCRIGASDASSLHGGRAAALVNVSAAQTLYRFAEHRGEHVRLDWDRGAIEPISHMQRAPPELEDLIRDVPWNQTESISFGHRQHINLLESKMIHRELVDVVRKDDSPARCVLLVDSRAAAGAWAKGRSSAKNLNRILRKSLGWTLAGRKTLHLVWVRSEANPSDYPSRKKRIPPPSDMPSETTKLALGDNLGDFRRRRSNRDIWRAVRSDGSVPDARPPVCNPSRVAGSVQHTAASHAVGEKQHPSPQRAEGRVNPTAVDRPALAHWSFREIFAGTGHLTKAFRARGRVTAQCPFEIMNKGKPQLGGDILHDATFEQLCKDACRPRQYWHFGFPCGSFSLMQNMNKGSRSKDRPLGNGTIAREIKGNEIMHRTIHLCHLLHAHGSLFTLENPLTSYAWRTPAMVDLIEKCGCHKVVFDQCQYGLQIPGELGELGLALKPTAMVGTLPHLNMLEKRCQHDRPHVAVVGGVKHQGKWQRRSQLAGAYPSRLRHRLAAAFERSFA